MARENFLDKLINRISEMDSGSIQNYVLRLSREKGFLETVFNTIRDGIIVIDRKLRIKYRNRAADELLGLPQDINKIRMNRLLRGVDWKKILQADIDEWYRVSRQEVEILYPQRRIIHFYLTPNRDSGETATIILTDVTENRERTATEIETGRLEAVSMLAAGVAHEIGNPLNSLYLHLQMLERQIKSASLDKNEAEELVATARSEVERLDSIINQFLKAVRPAKPQMQELDIKEVLLETLKFMRQEIEDRHISIKCSWPDAMPLINGDPAQLKQAFYNLLKNASQSMAGEGEIDISCSYGEANVEVSISDQGCGISAEEISKIFDPYYTTKKDGTGLGLMIVERIAREHGAKLLIDSAPGKGTSMTIRFPRIGRQVRVLAAPPEDINISEGDDEI